MIEKFKNMLRKVLLQKAKASIDLSDNRAYLEKKKIKYQYFKEEEKLEGYEPVFLSPCQDKALRPFDSFLEGYFLDIQNPKFRFTNNHLLDDAQNVIYHLGVPFEKLSIKQQLLPRKNRYLQGTVAYLSNTAVNHYGHWLKYIIPSLYIYQKYINLENIDYFYLGDFEKPAKFIEDTFEILKIPKAKLIYQPCHSDRMLSVVTRWKFDSSGKVSYLPKPYFDFVRNTFLKARKVNSTKNYPKKIYIQRGNVKWRFVVNELKILNILKNKGFEILSMDDLSLSEQVNYFQQAKVIIAPHGSALTNLIFCREYTKVLEILPYNYQENTSFQYTFWAQAQYYYMRGKKIDTDKEPPYEDILVDIDLLNQVLEDF